MAKPKARTEAPRGSGARVESKWISPSELEGLLEVMARHEVAELELARASGERLAIRRGRVAASAPAAAPVHVAPPPVAAPPPPPPAAPAPKVEAAESEDGVTFVTSPLVGTFYRSPSPDAAPFVDVGTRIRPGQRLCIVEAMKLMNEIEAEVEGTIVEVLVENGKPVEYGQKLFKVRTK